MIATLAHRGPDEGGVAIVGGADGLGPVCVLGHRRLRVIDLSPAARQPMSNEDGTVWSPSTARSTTSVELRSRAARRGHTFRSRERHRGDRACLRGVGDDLVARLDGMFAFALWDGAARRLLLARDRVGKKPLFTTRRTEAADGSGRRSGRAAVSGVRAVPDCGGSPRCWCSVRAAPATNESRGNRYRRRRC